MRLGERGRASLGFTWIHLDSLGFTDSFGLASTSLGFTLTHLILLGFNLHHFSFGFAVCWLDFWKGKGKPGVRKREKGKAHRDKNIAFPPYLQTARTYARTETKIDFPVGPLRSSTQPPICFVLTFCSKVTIPEKIPTTRTCEDKTVRLVRAHWKY